MTRFHVIVPERHEGEASSALRRDLLRQSVGANLYDVTFADGSHGKKAALRSATLSLPASDDEEWVVTTDADCEVSRDWLRRLQSPLRLAADKHTTDTPILIVGPVRVNKGKRGFPRDLETLEWLSLQGATRLFFPLMCNGANLMARRDVYERYLNERKDKSDYASGDDMFLLEYCKREGKVAYAPSAVVDTAGCPSFRAFVRQRLRWTSKASGYRDAKTIVAALGVWSVNAALLVLLALGLWMPLCVIWGVKAVFDFAVIASQAARFSQTNVLWCFVIAELLYPLYAVALGVATLFAGQRRDTW